MDNYIGKICPFCKTTINSSDEVMVCPACATPHHKGCWDENKGCTTFGCSEQHYVAQGTNPTDVCKKCGALLGDGQFFCPKCGHKVGLTIDSGVNSAIAQFNETQVKKNKKKIVVPIVAALVAIGFIGGGLAIVPKLFIDTAGYIEKGDLEKAYSKATNDEDKQLVIDAYMAKGDYGLAYDKTPDEKSKNIVKIESQIAKKCSEAAEVLKDPSSFSLRDAYLKEDTDSDGEYEASMVLYISGANSFGANVSSYWYFSYSLEKDVWTYWDSYTDLSEEEDEFYNNMVKFLIKKTISEGTQLGKDGTKRINDMFEAGILDKVEVISLTK